MHPRPVKKYWIISTLVGGCFLFSLLTACASSTPLPSTQVPKLSPTLLPPSATSTLPAADLTGVPASTLPSETSTSTPLPPDFWQKLPVIPDKVSDRMRAIYSLGLSLGNSPHVFSRIGDCNSAAPGFMVGFDGNYNLGTFTSLQPGVDYFKGSFKRPSLAAKAGLNTAGLLTTLWTGPECQSNESLLDCQYRLDHPSFAIIAIGSNETYYVHHDLISFERNLRLVIEDTLAHGIVPVLGTKADNLEGDNSINATIARLAVEYELPLWNFWRVAQTLPDLGLTDPSHLSSVSYTNFTDFSIPHAMDYGAQVHNLTALQMLDLLWQQIIVPAQAPTSTP